MEHASAAAFARFVLQLLAIAAPPSFVRDAALAAADEVTHAELCFAMAARFGSDDVPVLGPAPLSLEEALAPTPLAMLVADVIVEGCVGETTAAMIASRQLELASDGAVRQVLTKIRDDEAKHAELAWSFVRWAVGTGDEAVRASAARAFARALAMLGAREETACADGLDETPEWATFGGLSLRGRLQVARHALAMIVEPCARELLGTDRAGPG